MKRVLPTTIALLIPLIVTVLLPLAAIGTEEDRSLKREKESAGTRTALVIGNSAYEVKPLANPVNDAKAIAKQLEKSGFAVTLKTDVGRRKMDRAIKDFGRKLRKGGAGLFYFAGHGMQIGGRNYLLPVDVAIESESDVRYEAIDAGRVLGKMEDAGNGLNIVILDACRDNPFSRGFRSTASTGLAKMNAPTGSFIAYATEPDSVAKDGRGRHSPYTSALLTFMNTPGLTIEQMFKQVRNQVLRTTGKEQVPWESSSLLGEFYFSTQGGGGALQPSGPAQGNTASAPGYSLRADEELWRTVKEKDNLFSYEYFLKEFPGSPFAATARLKIAMLKEMANRSTLTVQTEPEDATIRILNIREQYSPGMRLTPGSYEVEVSAEGYKTRIEKIDLPASRDFTATIKLVSLGPKAGDTYTDPVTGMEFVYVEGGCFQMGDTFGDGYDNEKPVHEVCVDDFFMGKYEVTQDEYQKIMGANPSAFKNGSNYPVEQVSWHDAQDFITKLNSRSGKTFRLPTEAEWEYAAREGGKNVRFGTGRDTIGPDEANFDASPDYKKPYSRSGRYREQTVVVGSFSPNSLGLYDMSGNVWEWCSDWYGENYYSTSPRDNPHGPSSGDNRVVRGGSWRSFPRLVRAAIRLRFRPGYRNDLLGFRLLLQASSVQ